MVEYSWGVVNQLTLVRVFFRHSAMKRKGGVSMAWVYLIFAGLSEIAGGGLKMAQQKGTRITALLSP